MAEVIPLFLFPSATSVSWIFYSVSRNVKFTQKFIVCYRHLIYLICVRINHPNYIVNAVTSLPIFPWLYTKVFFDCTSAFSQRGNLSSFFQSRSEVPKNLSFPHNSGGKSIKISTLFFISRETTWGTCCTPNPRVLLQNQAPIIKWHKLDNAPVIGCPLFFGSLPQSPKPVLVLSFR